MHYNKKLRPFARELRNSSTLGEIVLWSKVLRARQMLGYQFNRQFAMKIPPLKRGQGGLNIIVDFICRRLKLIIEIDGYSHNFKHEADQLRDERLQGYGYYVLRITEHEVKYDLANVVSKIENKIRELERSIPSGSLST